MHESLFIISVSFPILIRVGAQFLKALVWISNSCCELFCIQIFLLLLREGFSVSSVSCGPEEKLLILWLYFNLPWLFSLSLCLSAPQIESFGFNRGEKRPGRLWLVRATHTFTHTLSLFKWNASWSSKQCIFSDLASRVTACASRTALPSAGQLLAVLC